MLLTAHDIAAHLSVSLGQAYRLARAHRIPCHRIGAAVRF